MRWHSDEEAAVLAERSGLGPRRSTATTTASSESEEARDEDEEEEDGPPRSAPAGAACCRRATLPPPLTGLPASGGPRLAEGGPGGCAESRERGPVLQGLADGGAEALACGLRCSCQGQRAAAPQQASEADALRAPLLLEPLRLFGRWEYALSAQGVGAFRITAGAGGEPLFGKESWSGRPVAGTLEPRGSWLQARLRFADDGEEQGEVRLRLERERGTVLLNFRRHSQAEWGPDASASKVAVLCPGGHALQACAGPEASCCSGCRRRMRKGGAAAACEACGFALCHACWRHEVPAATPGLLAAAWGALGGAPEAPGEPRGARVEVELAEGACRVRRWPLCAEALLREVRGCAVTALAEYRQQPLPLLHHLPLELPASGRSFALLELDRGAWVLSVEAVGADLALALGHGRAAGRYLEAFGACGGARPQSALWPVLQHARRPLGPQAGLPRACVAALAAWLDGPLAALWQPQQRAGAAPDMPRLLAGLLALLQGAPPAPAPLAERGRALEALQHDGALLRHCAPPLQADRELVAVAVAQSGLALRYAAPELRADPELALEAVRRDSRALHHVAPALLHDHDFLLAAACSRHTRATLVLSLAPPEVRDDCGFMCTAIRREPRLLHLAGRAAAQAAILAAWRASMPRRSLRRSVR